jgi:hypothetical protein
MEVKAAVISIEHPAFDDLIPTKALSFMFNAFIGHCFVHSPQDPSELPMHLQNQPK